MAADPSVSPADTIRHTFDRLLAQDSWERPHVEAGRAALDALLAVGERDKAEIEALKVCPAGTGCAINSGSSHCYHCRRNYPPDETWAQPFLDRPNLQRQTIESLHGLLDEYQKAGERDRRQIARLTEVGKAALIVADLNGERRSTYGRVVTGQEWTTALCNLEMVAIAARDVLADEEDAGNG